jgi:transcriptional regulator with XRE-family HTH domain
MKRDFVETFRAKLLLHGIKGKDLAQEAGRTPQNISEVLNKKVSPSIDSLNELLDAAERLRPGFTDEFYLALVGHIDLDNFVSSLSSNELAIVMMNVGQRLRKLGSRETAIAA